MTPYYERDGTTIYLGDCRDILPQLGPVDLVLTDPPFGIDGGRGGDSRKFGKGKYQKDKWEDTPEYIQELVDDVIIPRVASGQRLIITPGIRCLHLYPPPVDLGCLWQPASVTHGAWGFQTFSPILYYGKDPRAGIAQVPNGRQVTEQTEKNGHPCSKPMGAWKWLLCKGSLEGETILDPFMGSGTTLRAAKDLGRKAIGIEIEEKYCEIAVKRLAQEVMDLNAEEKERKRRWKSQKPKPENNE